MSFNQRNRKHQSYESDSGSHGSISEISGKLENLLEENTVGLNASMLARQIGIKTKNTGDEDEEFLKKRSENLDVVMQQVQNIELEIHEYEDIMRQ